MVNVSYFRFNVVVVFVVVNDDDVVLCCAEIIPGRNYHHWSEWGHPRDYIPFRFASNESLKLTLKHVQLQQDSAVVSDWFDHTGKG